MRNRIGHLPTIYNEVDPFKVSPAITYSLLELAFEDNSVEELGYSWLFDEMPEDRTLVEALGDNPFYQLSLQIPMVVYLMSSEGNFLVLGIFKKKRATNSNHT